MAIPEENFHAGNLDIHTEADGTLVIKLSDNEGDLEVEARMDSFNACKIALAILRKAGHPAGGFYDMLLLSKSDAP